MSVVQLAPGKRLSVEDVTRVANRLASIAIEESILAQVSAASVSNETVKANSISIPTSLPANYFAVVRAGTVVRLNSLINNRSLSTSTISTLVSTINNGFAPVGSTIDSALVDFLSGSGAAVNADCCIVNSSEVLSSSVDYKLTASEAKALQSFPLFAIGEAVLATQSLANLLRAVDSVVAFSAESVSLRRVDIFDPVVYETNRPHRGMMTSAGNIKLLLEGSKAVGIVGNPKQPAAAGSTSRDINALYAAPQSTGPCIDTLTMLLKGLDTEINSLEGSGHTTIVTAGEQSAAVANLVLQQISAMSNILSRASITRLTEMDESSAAETSPATLNSAPGAVLSQVVHVAEQLATETQKAWQRLNEKEAALRAPAAATTAAAATADDEANEDGSQQQQKKGTGKKEELDMSNMSAEQIAKIEAKRKAKADKAAAKAKDKEQRRSAGILLGQGTTLVRQFLQEYFTSHASEDQEWKNLFSVCAGNEPTSVRFWQETGKILDSLSSQGGRRRPKIPKGARDFTPDQMRIREQAFQVIRQVFKRHGGVEIDTPVFELKEVLTGKYGEDSKLIYDLADQGGELLSLRYDLTVPFARFLAMNSVGNIKRYHIAKVYRRDNPVLSKGRYREFYQCDFDIAGVYSPMTADAEVITVLTEILSALPVGDIVVKLNHRQILDAVFEICGVPAEKFRPICSAVDKLDKSPWEEVKREMVDEKGLSEEVADRIGTFVLQKNAPWILYKHLVDNQIFGTHEGANKALQEMKLLFDYLEAMGSLPYISFDLSLARGLDYYTGVIYEVVLVESGGVQVGSIAAGGRYDNLVGMFSVGGVQTPCVGGSIGVERVFTIMEKKAELSQVLQQQSAVQVYIASIGGNMLKERMKIARLLWQANISAEYSHLDNPKFKKQLDEALERFIPYMIVFGEEELAKQVVKVKNMREKNEIEVPVSELIETLRAQGCVTVAGTQGAMESDLLQALRAVNLSAVAPAAEAK